MKLNPTLIGSVLAASCFCLHAQNAATSGVEMPGVTIYGGTTAGTPQPNGEIYSPVTRFTEFIGMDVWNFQNERLGEVKAITADMENARLVEVLISSGGGFWNGGDTVTPVPPTALTFSPRSEVARLNVSKARFNAAPQIRMSQVTTASRPERVAAVSRYFGIDPWFSHAGHRKGRPALGFVQTTEAIHKMEIHNLQGRYMGKVGTLLMDLPRGRIVKVVDNTFAMGGTGRHILQPSALRYNARHDGLLIDETFAGLKEQPHFMFSDGRTDSYYTEVNAAQNAQARSDTMTGTLRSFFQSSPRVEVRRARPAR